MTHVTEPSYPITAKFVSPHLGEAFFPQKKNSRPWERISSHKKQIHDLAEAFLATQNNFSPIEASSVTERNARPC